MRTNPRVILPLVMLSLIGSICSPRGETPAVETILQHFVTALGGREALEQVHSMVLRGTKEFPNLKVTGTAAEYFKYPDHFAAITEIPGYGKMQTVYDGGHGWQVDPQPGVREILGVATTPVWLLSRCYHCALASMRLPSWRNSETRSAVSSPVLLAASISVVSKIDVATSALHSKQYFSCRPGSSHKSQ
jgi:hypothetical protein